VSTTSLHTEKELLLQIAAGDQKAFAELFDHYWNTIYGVTLAYIKSPDQAEDLVQEVFLILWKRKETLPGIGSLENYLFIITRNEVFRVLRKKGATYSVGEWLENLPDEKALTPEKALSLKQLTERIGEAVSLLPPQQRQAWQLSREQDLGHDEIAAAMGLSKNTVKNHIVKALNFIRDYLQSHSDALFLIAAWHYFQNL
jgi:RNA polymerase sigma-70 factor (family 1)